MSWNKNTQNCSSLDAIKRTLTKLEVPYELEVISKVEGRGLNDETGKVYELRRLQYVDVVVLEYMDRTEDCDMDDVIFSVEFDKNEEPEDWETVIYSGQDELDCDCCCMLEDDYNVS